MDLLEEFETEGFLPERVIPNSKKTVSKEVPKINPSMDQNIDATKADAYPNSDIPKSEPDDKAGDQNKDDDPSTNATEAYEDKMMNSAVQSMNAAEAALDNLCYQCDKGENKYSEDKKRKIHEIFENLKSLKSGLYEMATMEQY